MTTKWTLIDAINKGFIQERFGYLNIRIIYNNILASQLILSLHLSANNISIKPNHFQSCQNWENLHIIFRTNFWPPKMENEKCRAVPKGSRHLEMLPEMGSKNFWFTVGKCYCCLPQLPLKLCRCCCFCCCYLAKVFTASWVNLYPQLNCKSLTEQKIYKVYMQ